MVILPAPTLALPVQENDEPTPVAGPSNVIWQLESSFAHGDQSWNLHRSFRCGNTLLGGAASVAVRLTRTSPGRVAATRSTPITRTATTIKIVVSIGGT